MKEYSVIVANRTHRFAAFSDAYALDAVTYILKDKSFRSFGDEEHFQISGPDGPVALGYGKLGDIRAQ